MEEQASPKKVWDKTNSWSSELALLREIIDQTPLIATTKWGGEVYTINGKNVLGIAGFKHFFTIWFFKGVELSDPKKVLINAQEGKTKLLRQWRFRSQEEIDADLILTYIKEAIAIENTTIKK